MIFVTVGTHEQPFNRLIQKVDELKKEGVITEDVIIQTGFSTYELILSILVYTFFSRMFDLMLPPVAKHSIVVA